MSYEESGVVMKEKITANVYEVEENEESWVDKFLKIFSFGQKNDEGLTAKKANMIARFGMPDDFDSIVKKKVREIEQQIRSKLEFSSQERLLALIVPKDQEDLFEEVKKYYTEKGFKTFYVGKEQVKDFGDSKYLFISWDI